MRPGVLSRARRCWVSCLPVKLSRRIVVLAAIVIALVGFAVPAMAETAALQDSEELAPAEVAEEATEEEAEQPWTSRFLIPLFIVLTVLLIGGITIYYFVAIKNRYTVVQS